MKPFNIFFFALYFLPLQVAGFKPSFYGIRDKRSTHLSLIPKIEGSNPATCSGRKKSAKKKMLKGFVFVKVFTGLHFNSGLDYK